MRDKTHARHVVRSHFASNDAVRRWEAVYGDDKDFFSYVMTGRKAVALDVLSQENPEDGRLVADVGCGSGLVAKELLAMGYDVTGVDISEEMLENARKVPGLKLRVGDVENLPFDDGSFDKVVCLGVITYLPDERKALAELHRILKPDGLLILAVRNMLEASVLLDPVWNAVRIFKKCVGRFTSRDQSTAGSYYHRNFIPWILQRHLIDAGFTVRHCIGSGFDFPTVNGNRIVSMRAGVRLSRAIERLSRVRGFGFLCNWGLVYTVVATR